MRRKPLDLKTVEPRAFQHLPRCCCNPFKRLDDSSDRALFAVLALDAGDHAWVCDKHDDRDLATFRLSLGERERYRRVDHGHVRAGI
jgi:hypothetical protein